MHILIIAQYFKPENVGAAIWIHQLAIDLMEMGHNITILTGFPNYPKRVIFDGYKGRIFMKEKIDGIQIIRTYTYASPGEELWKRYLNFGSFCVSSVLGGIYIPHPDVIYCCIPPLPLGLTAEFIGLMKCTPVIINVQDIYPDIGIALGILQNPLIISRLKRIEQLIYRYSAGIVVISEGFKHNLLNKGVQKDKLYIVPNWADSKVIKPAVRDNDFRHRLGVGSKFTLIYSGNLSYNSNLEPLIEAAQILNNEPFVFVIVGDGVKKGSLERMTREKNLKNIFFLPFQPLENYPEVLAAADMNLVTLNAQATFASVPSKIYKAMSSARPILAISKEGNDVHRLISEANCGICVPPDNGVALAKALHEAASSRDRLIQWGKNARKYLEQNFSRSKCIKKIEKILCSVAR